LKTEGVIKEYSDKTVAQLVTYGKIKQANIKTALMEAKFRIITNLKNQLTKNLV